MIRARDRSVPRAKPDDAWEFKGNARFQVLRRLGEGGFGAVFEVLDVDRDARVALKLLRRFAPEELYRFKNEFRALADVAHRNLVPLYELSVEGDRSFFTMELVEGGTDVLAFVRPTSEGFDEARVRSALLQVVEGLTALHAAGKMHRDIKASNVLVTRDGRVVIVDFGLVVRLSTSGEASRAVVMGTPEYLAPELLRGHAASAPSDWYGVGVLLYEALTGQPPFTGTLHDVLTRKMIHDPPAPSAISPGVPPDLDALCMELLSRAPEQRPRGEALLARLGGEQAARSVRRERPFIGRAAERAALAALIDVPREKRAAVVALVGGPSGIGKSALIGRVLADLERRAPGALILAGRCYEQESVPYKALDGVIDALSRFLKPLFPHQMAALMPDDTQVLARLFPVLKQVDAFDGTPLRPIPPRDAQELRRRALKALRELLARVAAQRPLVLVIDDLQWGDRDSGSLLVELLAPPSPPQLALIAAFRDDEVDTSECLRSLLPALASMVGQALRVERVTVGALTDPEARELCRRLLPPERAGDEELCTAVAREAGGRPFFVQELAEHPWERDARGAEQGAPVSLDALLSARAEALPEAARRLLEVIAVAGRPVDRSAAEQAANLGDLGPTAYNQLRNARLIRRLHAEGRDDVEAYHDRIREAVAAGVPEERRAASLRRLAELLEGTGRADAETLAAYYAEGGERGRAVTQMLLAAEAAASTLAFDRAAHLYRRTLDLRFPAAEAPAGGEDGADAPEETRRLRELLGDALASAGRGTEAAEALIIAAEGAPRSPAFALRRRAAEQLLAAGRVDEGMATLRRCLAEADVRVPTKPWVALLGVAVLWVVLSLRGFGFRRRRPEDVTARVRIGVDVCIAAARTLNGVDLPLGAYFAARATLYALSSGDARLVFDALMMFTLYGAALRGGPTSTTDRAWEAAEALAEEVGAVELDVVRRLVRGLNAGQHGELGTVRELMEGTADAVRERYAGQAWALNLAHEFSFMWMNWTGAWEKVAERLPGTLEEARARGNHWLERSLLLRFGHIPRLLDDDPDGAARVQASAREGWWPARFGLWDYFRMGLGAEIAIYRERGRGRAAHRLIEEQWPAYERSGLLRLRGLWAQPFNARARAALAFAAAEETSEAERATALALAERIARALGGVPNPMALGLARLAEAGVAHARVEAGAASAYARAEEALVAAELHHYAAAARRRRGEILGGDEGAALVAAADGWLRERGARNPARLVAMLAPGRGG
jgi:hypothetical protein